MGDIFGDTHRQLSGSPLGLGKTHGLAEEFDRHEDDHLCSFDRSSKFDLGKPALLPDLLLKFDSDD